MIERSVGRPPTINGVAVPWAGPMPGGGYAGITDELDAVVARCAELLQAEYPDHDVTIRFNSSRLSGGAWLVDPAKDDAGVGLGAGLYWADGALDDIFGKGAAPSEWAKRAAGIRVEAKAWAAGDLHIEEVDDPEAGIAWLREHVSIEEGATD